MPDLWRATENQCSDIYDSMLFGETARLRTRDNKLEGLRLSYAGESDYGRKARLFAREIAFRRRFAFLGERNRCAVSIRLRSSSAATRATGSAPRRRIMITSRVAATSLQRAVRFARALV